MSHCGSSVSRRRLKRHEHAQLHHGAAKNLQPPIHQQVTCSGIISHQDKCRNCLDCLHNRLYMLASRKILLSGFEGMQIDL